MRRAISVFLLCGAGWLSSCNSTQAPAKEDAQPVKQYKLHGEILSLDPEGHLAKVKHDDIEGWMKAMTMEYPVKDPAEYKTLHAGECVDATVYVQDLQFWVGQIRESTVPGACVRQ